VVARALLEGEGFEVVGEAGDGEQAVAEVARLRPRVVLLDVHLPGADGFAVSEVLASLEDPPAVVLTSSRPIGDLRRRLTRSHAVGFVRKDDLSGPSLTVLIGR